MLLLHDSMQGYGFAVATGVIIASEMSEWRLAGGRVDAIVPAKKGPLRGADVSPMSPTVWQTKTCHPPS